MEEPGHEDGICGKVSKLYVNLLNTTRKCFSQGGMDHMTCNMSKRVATGHTQVPNHGRTFEHPYKVIRNGCYEHRYVHH